LTVEAIHFYKSELPVKSSTSLLFGSQRRRNSSAILANRCRWKCIQKSSKYYS